MATIITTDRVINVDEPIAQIKELLGRSFINVTEDISYWGFISEVYEVHKREITLNTRHIIEVHP